MAKQKFKGFVPGKFYYFSGDVWECDNNGQLHRRRDCGPNYKGNFKSKFYKKGK